MADNVAPQSEETHSEASAKPHMAPLVIDEERGLVQHRKAIASRLAANPEAMRMLIVNPVLAFRDAGIRLSPAVANHVLHAIQYPPEVRAERDRLQSELKAALGRSARPTDPQWLAEAVFGQLVVTPVLIGDHEPVYRSSFDAKTLSELQTLLPTRGVVTIPAPTPVGPAVTAVTAGTAGTPEGETPVAPGRMYFEPKSLELLDLDAPVPDLPPAGAVPDELSLVDSWFYKDAAPPVRLLLSLGIIMSSGVAIYSSSQYRKIANGEAESEVLSWITAVRVPSTRSK